jgi:hypothetical protein
VPVEEPSTASTTEVTFHSITCPREPAAMVAPYDRRPSDAQLCCQFQDTINAGAF